MKKSKTLLLISALLYTILSCKKAESTSPDYNKGELTILTDPAFESVTTALADGYMINYPETKLTVQTKKEDFAFMDLIDNKVRAIVMSRELSKEEIDAYEKKVDLKILPSKFAADAVIFVVPKNSSREKISYEEIQEMLESDSKDLIFPGTNSSDLNFVAQTMGKKPADLQFSIISGAENLVAELDKYPNKIGVIGLNNLSRPYGKEADHLRNMVKILPVEKDGKVFQPDSQALLQMTYPFTRVLYFLTNEGNFSIANGFIRFSCTHLGQMIVQKEGLQRYNLFKRQVQMR